MHAISRHNIVIFCKIYVFFGKDSYRSCERQLHTNRMLRFREYGNKLQFYDGEWSNIANTKQLNMSNLYIIFVIDSLISLVCLDEWIYLEYIVYISSAHSHSFWIKLMYDLCICVRNKLFIFAHFERTQTQIKAIGKTKQKKARWD